MHRASTDNQSAQDSPKGLFCERPSQKIQHCVSNHQPCPKLVVLYNCTTYKSSCSLDLWPCQEVSRDLRLRFCHGVAISKLLAFNQVPNLIPPRLALSHRFPRAICSKVSIFTRIFIDNQPPVIPLIFGFVGRFSRAICAQGFQFPNC